jgi:hypothetical protein
MSKTSAPYEDPKDVLRKANEALKRTSSEEVSGLPDLPDLQTIKGLEDLKAAQVSRDQYAENCRKFLDGLAEALTKVVSVIFSGLPESHAEVVKARKSLTDIVSVKDEALAWRARWEYAAVLTRYALERGGNPPLPAIIQELTRMGVLEIREVSGRFAGLVFAFQRENYVPARIPGGTRLDAEKTFRNLYEIRKVVGEAVRARLADEKKAFLAGASRSWEDLLAAGPDKDGTYVVAVPPYERRNLQTGEVVFVRNGLVKLEKRDGAVGLVSALTGNSWFRRKVEELAVKGATLRVADISREHIKLPERFREREDLLALHGFLHKAYLWHQEAVASRKAQDALREKASVKEAADFLREVNPAFGTAVVFHRTFQWGATTHRNIAVLVERAQEGIRVLEVVPANLTGKLFTESCFRCTPEGDLAANPATKVLSIFLRIARKKIEAAAARRAADAAKSSSAEEDDEEESGASDT